MSSYRYSSESAEKIFISKIIGLEYDSFSNLGKDYNLVEEILKKNEDISSYNSRFYNPDFNEEHYNYIKNHGTAYNINFDKLCFKGIYNNYWKKYRNIGLIVNINSVELYEIDNEKYVPTRLKKEEYPEFYDALKKYYADSEDIYIPVKSLEFSPFENKIIGCRFYEYCY